MAVIILCSEVRDRFDRDCPLFDLGVCVVANVIWRAIKRAALRWPLPPRGSSVPVIVFSEVLNADDFDIPFPCDLVDFRNCYDGTGASTSRIDRGISEGILL